MGFLPSKGLKIEYTTDLTSPYATPAFAQLGCVQSAKNMQSLEVETAEHRCLDDTQPQVETVPTGYVKYPNATIKVGGSNMRVKYKTMKDFAEALTKLSWQFTWPADPTQGTTETVKSSEIFQAYVVKVDIDSPDDGGETTMMIELAKTNVPVFAPGS